MKVLVTGGSGLLGSRLVLQMKSKGHDVIPTFRSTEHGHNYMDLTDFSSIKHLILSSKPDCIVHTAALTNVDYCESHPEEAMSINGKASGIIARNAAEIGAFLVYVSTDYVFDGKKGFYSEEDETHPVNIYGKSKLLGEEEVKKKARSFAIVRSSVIYGSSKSRGKVNFALWILDKLSHHESIKVVNDQFVSPTLNSNLAEMICEVCERKLEGIFHLSGATRIDRYSFAVKIAEVFSLDKVLMQPVSSEEMNWVARRPMDSSLNVSKASVTLRTKPLGLDEALKRLMSELKG
jgi:dTDP-4-dehydrorhamnose reductase